MIFPEPSHATTTSATEGDKTGGKVSIIEKVAAVVMIFPQLSAAIKLTTNLFVVSISQVPTEGAPFPS